MLQIFRKPATFVARHPVGVIGVILGALGLLVALCTYHQSQKRRELTYYVTPFRNVILQYGSATHLQVFHKGQELKSNVTAVQVAIWNAGDEGIETGDILSPIRILTTPSIPILEATIRDTTRDVIEFAIADTLFEAGIIPVTWKILEKNDGALVEIIYAGSPEIDIEVKGVMREQPHVFCLKPLYRIESPTQQAKKHTLGRKILVYIAVTLFLIGLANIIVHRYFRSTRPKTEKMKYDRMALNLVTAMPYVYMIIAIITIIVYLFLIPQRPTPPFDI